MNTFALLFSTAFAAFFLTSPNIETGKRMFLFVLYASTVYYGILGPWYWLTYQDGAFLGVDWNAPLGYIGYYFCAIFIGTTLIVALTFRTTFNSPISADAYPISERENLRIRILATIGAFSSIYVVLGAGTGDRNTGATDGVMLISLQFSDLLVAVFLFLYARERLNRIWIAILVLFTIYSVIVGLRYRLLLLFGPMLLSSLWQGIRRSPLRALLSIIGVLLLVTLFSLLTISREKFSGVNFDALSSVDPDLFLYGLFAETNIIFGLGVSLEIFGSKEKFAGLTPLLDSLTQFIPRALYPEKHLYTHLESIQYWLGGDLISMQSGTAPPFFAEYFAMGGYTGIAIGVIIFSLLVSFLLNVGINISSTKRQALVTQSFISIYFGYYYFSRGSVAQIFKGITFIIIPYLILLATESRRISRGRTSCKQ
ncbi:hypothetical protein KGA65_16970 [Ideonella sp. B7]|uniref:hypothetical protein n=1 Tax=Ideonella benzenivorans TaxID=2831643 RepID=UPI001CECF63B|nr:hypothetical protein [Ideonella benzenivorans]MCA6218228.1 hypothetical protein [Ideonella benzenivorans]